MEYNKTTTTFKTLNNLIEANSNYDSLQKKIKVREIIDGQTQNKIKNQ